MGSDGKVLSGQQYDPRKDLSFPFTERQHNYTGPTTLRVTGLEGTAAMDQTPTDEAAAKVRQYDIAGIVAAALAAPAIVLAGKTRVAGLPDVLNSITCSFNKAEGSGVGNHPASQMAGEIVNRGSGNISPKSRAQGSASIVPSVTYDRDTFADRLVNCLNYYYYSANPVTIAAAATKTGATNLPNFKPKELQLVLKGAQISVQNSADSSASLSFDSDATLPGTSGFSEYGNDNSKEVGTSSRVESIPPTLHAAITLSSNTDTATVTVSAQANTVDLVKSGSTLVPAITNEPADVTGTASASITNGLTGNATIAATSPTNIPRTGFYIVDIDGQLDDFGLVLVHVTVVDFSQYA